MTIFLKSTSPSALQYSSVVEGQIITNENNILVVKSGASGLLLYIPIHEIEKIEYLKHIYKHVINRS